MVLLVTSDSEQFNADREVVERSVLIKNMLEGVCQLLLLWKSFQHLFFHLILDVGESDQPIPLPNVSSSVLKKVSLSFTRI
jgi:S-phase kinase-associated protein 1